MSEEEFKEKLDAAIKEATLRYAQAVAQRDGKIKAADREYEKAVTRRARKRLEKAQRKKKDKGK